MILKYYNIRINNLLMTLIHTQIPYFKREVYSIILLIYHYTKSELYLSMPRSFSRFSIKLHGSLNQSVSIWFPSNLGAFIIESILWPQLTGTVHGICPKVLTDKFIQMFIFPNSFTGMFEVVISQWCKG